MKTSQGALRRYSNLFKRFAAGRYAAQDYTRIVDAQLLGRLDRLSLAVGRDLVTGLMGEHLARRRTAGIEFADYRRYSAGDDLRRIDWNAYARLGTLHVRQAQAEHDTSLYLLLDASPSMGFGVPPKFWAARRLCAALGYISLAYLDNVIVSAPGSQAPSGLSAYRGRAQSGDLFRYLQDVPLGAPSPFDAVLTGWSTQRGQGRVAVVISDLLLDEFRDGVRALAGAGFAVTLLHLLSPEEISPQGSGELELVDGETGERLEVHLGRAGLAEYRRRLDGWLAGTREWCRGLGVSYFQVSSDTDVERVLLDTLRRGGVTE